MTSVPEMPGDRTRTDFPGAEGSVSIPTSPDLPVLANPGRVWFGIIEDQATPALQPVKDLNVWTEPANGSGLTVVVMGPTHAMAGAAAWLALVGAAGAGVSAPGMEVLVGMPFPVVAMGAAVCAGGALLPDIDCPGSLSLKDGSTVVRAFGIAGEAVGKAMDGLALLVFDLTKSRHDTDRHSGHRLLTHTAVFAVGLGMLTSLAASLPGTFTAGGKRYSTGTAMALLIMWTCLHLALFGLFEKWTKKQRKTFSLVGVMVFSAALTIVTALALPAQAAGGKFWWLGLAVGGGSAVHCLGDAITRAGVPFVWPIPIRGRRWREIQLPSLLSIRAGGRFEYAALFPVLTALTLWLVVYTVPESRSLAVSVADLIGVHVPTRAM
jgi:hypothetical protein